MEIYVVEQGDTILSISKKFGIPLEKLSVDNGLDNQHELIVGQALVIASPKTSYIVRQGDTLQGIAESNNISLMKLLQYNPYLCNREYIYPGEVLTINYNTTGSITTNGFAYTFIKHETLIQTLPNLTYLTIFNYTTTLDGEIIALMDDTDIINTSREYQVIPLLMLTAITPQGVPNIELAYKVLFNPDFQDVIINEAIIIMKSKGYQGINVVFNYLNENNQKLYHSFVERMANQLNREGFMCFLTFNYNVRKDNHKISFDQIDYSKFNTYANGMIFLKFNWGTNFGPPAPISDINIIRALIDQIRSQVSREKLVVGKPMMGLDWQLPYKPNSSSVVPLTFHSVLNKAREFDTVIQFDEVTQTPYFYYNQFDIGYPYQHIVWFIDARSLNALDILIKSYGTSGNGIWNIMIYNPQIWTIINARFDIIKKG